MANKHFEICIRDIYKKKGADATGYYLGLWLDYRSQAGASRRLQSLF